MGLEDKVFIIWGLHDKSECGVICTGPFEEVGAGDLSAECSVAGGEEVVVAEADGVELKGAEGFAGEERGAFDRIDEGGAIFVVDDDGLGSVGYEAEVRGDLLEEEVLAE